MVSNEQDKIGEEDNMATDFRVGAAAEAEIVFEGEQTIIMRSIHGLRAIRMLFYNAEERGKFIDALQAMQMDYCISKDERYQREVIDAQDR